MNPSAHAVALLTIAVLAAACAVSLLAGPSLADGGPPADGDWNVSGTYVLEDRVVMLRGDLIVAPGGDLTVRNSTLIVSCDVPMEHGIHIRAGGTMRVLDGSVLTSSRSSVQWTWHAERGSTLVLRGSTVKWCGAPAWGEDPENPDWRVLGLCVETSDATIEDCRFERGFIGICFPNATTARAVRNCSFENHYGIMTQSTDVVDCTFGGVMYRGVWLWMPVGGEAATVSRCTFIGMRTAGVHAHRGPNFRIVGCTFKGGTKGIWVDNCSNLTIEGCVFDGMSEKAVHVDSGTVHVVDGIYTNTSSAFWIGKLARLDWTVRGDSTVIGADVMLSDDLVIEPGAHLRLLECRNLSMLSPPSDPLSIVLGDGAVLEMSNTTIDVVEQWMGTTFGAPVRIDGPGASLRLVGIDRLDVSFPIELGELWCRDSVLPLGTWNVSTIHLDGCRLVRDPRGSPAAIVVAGEEGATSSDPSGELRNCVLDGIPEDGTPSGPWLSVRAGRLRSVDFLSDLQAMVIDGELDLPEEEGRATIEVAWSIDVEAYWQNGLPAVGAMVRIIDRLGSVVFATTDAEGQARFQALMTEVATSASDVKRFYPFTVIVEASTAVCNETVPEVTSTLTVIVIIQDSFPPLLSLDQGDLVGTRVPNIALTGVALDRESGVAFLQVRLESGDYIPIPIRTDGTFEVSVRVPTGLHDMTFQLYDQAGNRAERRITVYHSTQAPRIFSVEPTSGTLVNTSHVMLTGETERNVTVEAMGRSQLTTNGTFSILVPVVEGENRLTLNFTDLAGNTNVTIVRIVSDTVRPDLSITAPARSPTLTNEQRSVIEGITEVGSRVLVNSVEFLADGSGRFSVTVSLSEGESTFTVSASDAAGNSRTSQVVFILDTRPPSLKVLWPPEGVLMTRERSVLLELEVGADASLTLNGAPLAVTGPPMRVRVNLTEGENPLVLRATDALGNSVEVTRWVTSHTTPPSLTLDPQPPTVTSDPTMKLTGRTDPGAGVTVNGVALSVDGNGRFQMFLLLARGTTHLTVVSTDAFGNTVNVSCDVMLAPPPPDVRGPAPSLFPMLSLATVGVLVIEGVVLALWARRGRRKGAPDPPDGSSGPRG